jgi:PAT family beta-lactamase induction signal transducer AmpG
MRTSRKLLLLGSLYFSQGLPFGFFTQALPVLLRKTGMSLAMIGSTALLALPWMLKFLWAPAVDRYGSLRWGARRGWIIPLQALTVLLMLSLSLLEPGQSMVLLFAGVLMANFFAASQDIATDALAVDLLSEKERGFGNGVQVAGYRVGMIVGGGLLLVVFEQLGWERSFWVIALLLCIASVPIWFHVEPRRPPPAERPGLGLILRALARPSVRTFIPVLVTYKSADAFGTAMLRPYLVDHDYSLTRIGWVLGTLGFVAGLSGALAGGALASRFDRRRLLGLFACLHAAGLGGYALCASGVGGEPLLLGTIVFEHFAGGMATAALFTVMMDHTEPDSAATDYTAQACLVLLGNGLFAWPSGLVAERLGYAGHFALAMGFGCAAGSLALLVIPRVSSDG